MPTGGSSLRHRGDDAHFLGQFSCGFFCSSPRVAKLVMLGGMGVSFLLTLVFFLPPSPLWMLALVVCGYSMGCAVAAWGYFLREFTPRNERIKSCADVLIISNIIMIAINVVAVNSSVMVGLVLSLLCLPVGMLLVCFIPVPHRVLRAGESGLGSDGSPKSEAPSSSDKGKGSTAAAGKGRASKPDAARKPASNIRKPMGVLFLFVALITVDSGLMYQVINPAFEHLTQLTSWYWAVPYIIALIVMRNLPVRLKRSVFLYVGMGMIMCAFITFMLLGRSAVDYIVVDTLMLGACGIFDLFWWSIIGEMLDYTKNPAKVFGIGLSANVFGVLCGALIGVTVTSIALPEAQVAVIALCVVCVTLILLPPLNRQLALLLKTHAYLSAYSELPEAEQEQVAAAVKPFDSLTEREMEILQLVLDGKNNKEIAAASFITENTVKTHLKSIYAKYGIASRAELISLLLRGQER